MRLTLSELVLTLGGSYVCANFGENRSRNATVRVLADGHTHWQTQTDFIICPMLYAIAMGQIITNFNTFVATNRLSCEFDVYVWCRWAIRWCCRARRSLWVEMTSGRSRWPLSKRNSANVYCCTENIATSSLLWSSISATVKSSPKWSCSANLTSLPTDFERSPRYSQFCRRTVDCATPRLKVPCSNSYQCL